MGTLKSGWCITGHHDECPHVTHTAHGVWERVVCPCDCHPQTDEQSVRRSEPTNPPNGATRHA